MENYHFIDPLKFLSEATSPYQTVIKSAEILKENGFEVISQNGSHVKMKNLKTDKTVIVPYHSKDLKKGLEQAILKQAGLK